MRTLLLILFSLVSLPLGSSPRIDPIQAFDAWKINRVYAAADLAIFAGTRARFVDSIHVDGNCVAFTVRYIGTRKGEGTLTLELDADRYGEFRLQTLRWSFSTRRPEPMWERLLKRIRTELAPYLGREETRTDGSLRWEWMPRTSHVLVFSRTGSGLTLAVVPKSYPD